MNDRLPVASLALVRFREAGGTTDIRVPAWRIVRIEPFGATEGLVRYESADEMSPTVLLVADIADVERQIAAIARGEVAP